MFCGLLLLREALGIFCFILSLRTRNEAGHYALGCRLGNANPHYTGLIKGFMFSLRNSLTRRVPTCQGFLPV